MKNWRKKAALVLVAGLLSAAGAVTALAASKTRLERVTGVYWGDDGTTANWDEVEDANQYEIRLYCDDSQVTSVKTKKEHYDMESKMTKTGNYTFKVRALARSTSKEFADGYWSEKSEETYISPEYAEKVKNGGTAASGGPAGGQVVKGSGASVVGQAKWVQEEGTGRWWYRNADGSYPANGWWQDPANGTWYFFDAQGYMQTGWIDWNGSRYYCTESGAMAVGEYTIDGTVYRFDASGVLQ